MGKEGKYDLKLAGPPPVPESSEEEEEDMKGRWAISRIICKVKKNTMFATRSPHFHTFSNLSPDTIQLFLP